MSESNPYNAPGAAVADTAVAYADPKFFGTGRLGRLRYFGYSVMITVLLYLLLGIGAAVSIPLTAGSPEATASIIAGLYGVAGIFGIVVSVFLGVQRLHDLDKSGWLWLLFLVPIVNILFSFYLLFAPGSEGENQYGLPPKPNGTGVYLAAFALPVVLFVFIGIIAAIAIPQYQEYVEQAQQMEQSYMDDGAYADDGYNR